MTVVQRRRQKKMEREALFPQRRAVSMVEQSKRIITGGNEKL